MRKTGCVAALLAMCLLTGCSNGGASSAAESESQSSQVREEVECETAATSYDVEAAMGESDSSLMVEDPVMELDYQVYTTQNGLIVMATNTTNQTRYEIKVTATLKDENGEHIDSYSGTIAALQPGETQPTIIRVPGSAEYDSISIFSYSDTLNSASTLLSSYVTSTHSVAQDGTLDVTIVSSYGDVIEHVSVIVIFMNDGSPVGFDYYYTYLAAEGSDAFWLEGPTDSDGNDIAFDDAEIFVLATTT